ncbi:MAG: tetratricopeptide repeat protein [Bacteroidota bacterium]|nr:tetratricopeptide repeat protein [Bacteroidota bacterium]
MHTFNRIILLLLFNLLLFSGYATNVDSLLLLLEGAIGNQRAELLNLISETYVNTSAEKSVQYAQEALEAAENVKNTTEEVRAYKNIGNAYNLLNANELAVFNYEKALALYQETYDYENIIDVLIQIAYVYYKVGDYSNALNFARQSLANCEQFKDSTGISESFNTLGVIYWKLGDLDKALEYQLQSLSYDEEENHNTFNNIGIIYGVQGNFNKALNYQLRALDIRKDLGLIVGIAGSLNNIGIIYKQMGKLDTALVYFLEALDLREELGQPWRLAGAYNNVGSIYRAKGDYSMALEYFRKSLIYSNAAENTYEYASTLLNIGDVFLELKVHDSANIYLQDGIILANRIHAQNLLSDGYYSLYQLYYDKLDYLGALEYYKAYSILKDSVFSRQSKDKISELRIKYETEEKEKENELLKKLLEVNNSLQVQKLSRARNIRNLFAVILFLVIILIFLFYNRFTIRKKTNKMLTDKNIQINRINQDLRKLNNELEKRVKERTKNLEDEILERKQAEKIQRVLFKIARAANTAISLKDLLWVIQQEISRILDLKNFFIALYDKEKDRLSLPFFVDERDHFESFPEGKTLTSYVIRKKQMMLLRSDDIEQLVQNGDIDAIGTMCKAWLGVPLRSEGEIIGAFVVQSYENENAFNRSDIKVLEFIADQIGIMIERKSTEEKLKASKEKAEESDRLKTSFLTNMSHEIRTPMNAIIGFSNLLLKPDLSQRKKGEYVAIIRNNSASLLKIIDDIIDTARIEVGEIKIEEENSLINKIMDEILTATEEMKGKHGKKDIDLILKKGEPDDDFRVKTDPYRIRQILSNLLSNAIKFVDKGYIEFGYRIEEDEILFYVKDTGIGIPVHKQEFIFERFRQVEESYTRKYGGTGLGLTICRNLVVMIGGKIWVESEEGKGTTFYFTIPFKQADKLLTSVEEEPDQVKVPEKWNWKDKSIMVAEDVDSNFELVKELLEKTAAKIVWVKDGQEAIDTCQDNDNIDLILMDISMPKLDGLSAAVAIKKFRKNLPIIAVTAFAKAEEKEKFLNSGCDDYIAKPISEEELIEAISRYLS